MSRKLAALAALTTAAAAVVAVADVATPGFSAASHGDLPAPPKCTAADNSKHTI